MKVPKLTTCAQFWFTQEARADEINAATPFGATEILGISKYVVHPILPLNDMYSFFSSSEEN